MALHGKQPFILGDICAPGPQALEWVKGSVAFRLGCNGFFLLLDFLTVLLALYLNVQSEQRRSNCLSSFCLLSLFHLVLSPCESFSLCSLDLFMCLYIRDGPLEKVELNFLHPCMENTRLFLDTFGISVAGVLQE